MYGGPRSRIVHGSRNCGGRLRDLRKLTDAESRTRRPCRRCGASCLICRDPCDGLRRTCHSLCAECAVAHVHNLANDPLWDRQVVACPCGSGTPMEWLPAEAEAARAEYATRPDPTPLARRCAIEETIDRLGTARCPRCEAAVFDFDGCCALQCRCRAHFCGLCLEPAGSSRECHEHVQTCRFNPKPGDYFLTSTEFERARRRARSWRLLRRVVHLCRTESILYGLSTLRALRRCDIPVAPSEWESIVACAGAALLVLLVPRATLVLFGFACVHW